MAADGCRCGDDGVGGDFCANRRKEGGRSENVKKLPVD